ncbi:MAG: hypothetical protein AT716_01390 [Vulcanisaeta sp. MG_3]|nr:MAG: hypothetical protein AT716_01390 [Vulcanisaeta sp. MG_3]
MTWVKSLWLAIILLVVVAVSVLAMSIYVVPMASPTPPPSSYILINITAPNYASWTIYANASTGWYAYYSGSGSMSFGPAYAGGPSTVVTFNVTSLTNCPYPTIMYEPSNNITLASGANYETITINCVPEVNATFNVTSGGGVVLIISTPGFVTTQSLIINGPYVQSMMLPMNSTVLVIAWPFSGYTLEGVYVNGEAINYTETPYGSFHATIVLTTNSTVSIEFSPVSSG